MSLKELLIFSVVIFSVLSAFLVLLHEYHLVNHDKIDGAVTTDTNGKIGNCLLIFLFIYSLSYSLTQ